MRPLQLACLAVCLIFASAIAEPPPATAPTADIMKELRKIEAAGYRLGGSDAARVDYQALLRNRPSDYMLRVYVAWCSMPTEDAWNQLKGLASVNPDLIWLHYGMGRIYTTWKGMRDQAKAEYEQALKRDPKFYPALTGLGEVARGQEDWARAEEQYRAALAINDDPMAHAGLGLTLQAEGKTDDAVAELKKAIAGWPEQPAALNALLKLLIDAKDPAAADVAQRLTDLQPRNREVRKLLANLRFDAGEKKEAAKEYERLFRLGNPDPALALRLATIYREENMAEDEERTLNLVSSLDKTNADVPLRLSELMLAKNDLEGARGQALEALSRDPKRAETQVRLAKLAVQSGTLYEALDHYRAAAALGSDEAKTAAAKLEADFKLPKVPAKGSVDAINASISSSLDRFFVERRAAKRSLSGTLKVRVKVDKDGVVQAVDLIDDTVGDPYLAGHVYARLKDAQFPKQKREPVFEFELGQKKAQ